MISTTPAAGLGRLESTVGQRLCPVHLDAGRVSGTLKSVKTESLRASSVLLSSKLQTQFIARACCGIQWFFVPVPLFGNLFSLLGSFGLIVAA